jgi:hypothetical protein
MHTKVIVLDSPPHIAYDLNAISEAFGFRETMFQSFHVGVGDQKKSLAARVHKTFVFIKKTKSEILKTSFFFFFFGWA